MKMKKGPSGKAKITEGLKLWIINEDEGTE